MCLLLLAPHQAVQHSQSGLRSQDSLTQTQTAGNLKLAEQLWRGLEAARRDVSNVALQDCNTLARCGSRHEDNPRTTRLKGTMARDQCSFVFYRDMPSRQGGFHVKPTRTYEMLESLVENPKLRLTSGILAESTKICVQTSSYPGLQALSNILVPLTPCLDFVGDPDGGSNHKGLCRETDQDGPGSWLCCNVRLRHPPRKRLLRWRLHEQAVVGPNGVPWNWKSQLL